MDCQQCDYSVDEFADAIADHTNAVLDYNQARERLRVATENLRQLRKFCTCDATLSARVAVLEHAMRLAAPTELAGAKAAQEDAASAAVGK